MTTTTTFPTTTRITARKSPQLLQQLLSRDKGKLSGETIKVKSLQKLFFLWNDCVKNVFRLFLELSCALLHRIDLGQQSQLEQQNCQHIVAQITKNFPFAKVLNEFRFGLISTPKFQAFNFDFIRHSPGNFKANSRALITLRKFQSIYSFVLNL